VDFIANREPQIEEMLKEIGVKNSDAL